MKFCIEVLCII